MGNRLMGDNEMNEVAQAIVWRYVDGNIKDSVLEGWLDRNISDEDVDEFLQKWGPTIEEFGDNMIDYLAARDEIKEWEEDHRSA